MGGPELPFTYEALPDRADAMWPGGAHVAVYLELNIESWPAGKRGLTLVPAGGASLDPLNYGWRDYGARVGIWRILDVVDRHGIVASAAIDSDACALYPEIVQAGVERAWRWIAHGQNGSVLQGTLSDVVEEERYLTEMLSAIAAATGSTPLGWLGPALTETRATVALLAKLGLTHVVDWSNDDQPYELRTDGPRMVAVPRSAELSDITAFVIHGWSAEQFADASVAAFDALYESGRRGTVFGVAVHPFLLGAPARIRQLDRLLAHVSSRSGAWLATTEAIADWTLRRPDSVDNG
jgi:allantoinase